MVNEIQLHRLDLNLLVTFETLMDVRSVTLAAEKLGKTPSAVSHALARLREQLDDPLMVKVGGKMQPSPFALRLIKDVRPILRAIQRVVTPPQPFVPAQSRRTFRVALLPIPGLMSRVYERVNAEAPDASLEWASPTQRTYGQVADGLVDLAMLGVVTPMPEGVAEKLMPPVKIYVFARAGHPAVQNWSKDAWLRWPHIVVGLGTSTPTRLDEQVAALGVERRIGARVPDFPAIGPLLGRTNFLASQFCITLVDDIDVHNLVVLQHPIDGADGALRLVWSSRLANDPGTRWLRRIVIECYEDLVRFTETKLAQAEIIVPTER